MSARAQRGTTHVHAPMDVIRPTDAFAIGAAPLENTTALAEALALMDRLLDEPVSARRMEPVGCGG